jgi:hypothetical protein
VSDERIEDMELRIELLRDALVAIRDGRMDLDGVREVADAAIVEDDRRGA